MQFISEKHILKRAKNVENKSLSEFLAVDSTYEVEGSNAYNTGKGSLGQLVEEIVFGYKINSNKEADFSDFGLELKVASIKEINKQIKSKMESKKAGYSVKERIVLSIIDYMALVHETWDTNSVKKKMMKILLMFYLYDNSVHITDQIFKLVDIWEPSEQDLEIIKQDWEVIVTKVREGKAHEISEGDTYYLGACTKGSSKHSTRQQPYNDILAMQRAFSLKRNYADEIFNELYTKQIHKKGKSINIEETIRTGLLKYRTKSLNDILNSFKSPYANSKAKNRLNLIATSFMDHLLGESFKKNELVIKAGLELKTILLLPNGKPKEAMSFEQIDYESIVEEDWETSEIKSKFESKKHIWVVFQATRQYDRQKDLMDNEIILKDVLIWNMPISDLDGPYKILWEDTVLKVLMDDFDHFLGQSQNPVGHIRPKAKNSSDRAMYKGRSVPKKCFWLNTGYIAEQIELHKKG